MNKEERERAGTNEAVFRQVNEGIERGQWPGEDDEPVSFRCECAQLGCTDLVTLTRNEYETVRANGRWFVMVGGHERPEVETVIARRPGYIVVEKRGEAAERAEATDPRD